jgi:PAS domain S-box-containing protein
VLIQGVVDYAIFMLSPDGYVKTWNPGAERIKGYKPAEILGRHFSQFYTDSDKFRGEPQRALHTATTEGRYEKEGWRVRNGGSRFWASVIIDRITDPEGRIVGFAKVTRDLTERKKAQEAMDRARAALAQAQTDGSHRPAHRGRGARLQQSADRHHEQSRPSCDTRH